MVGDASFDIWACEGGGGGAILFWLKNVCCPAIDKKMLRVVSKIIIQWYLKTADGIHVFFTKFSS